MRPLRAWMTRIAGMVQSRRRDREVHDELRAHVDFHVEENMRAGMLPDQAKRDALLKLGGVDQVREQHRDRQSLPWLEAFVQDVRQGLRLLRKNPGFTIVAVV